MKKTLTKFIAVAMMLSMVVALASCAKSKVPDTYNYSDFSKYITLGEYKGVTYTEVDTTVTDDEVQADIDETIEASVEEKQVDKGTVEKDSTVNIDYTGYLDGEAQDDMTDTDVDITIQESGFIDGFAEQIVGHDVGETFDINVTFPDDYTEESLRGVEAKFTITVNYLIEKTYPELTDDWVKENTDYETVDEYRAGVREILEEEKAESALETEQAEVFGKIVEASEIVEYPETELNAVIDSYKETYKEYAESYGMEYADFLTSLLGMTEEEFDAEVETAAQNSVKQELVLHALASEYGVKITDKQYSDFLDGLLEDADMDRDSFEEQYGETIDEYAEDYGLYDSYLYETVMEKVMADSVASDGSDESTDSGDTENTESSDDSADD